MNNWFKRNGIHLAVIGIFIAICFFYFTPAFQGKVLGQSDVIGAQSTQTEINAYKAKDTTILWTNQIFGGMPTFQIWAPYSDNIASHVVNAINLSMPYPVGTVLILLIGSYFLFCVLRLNPWLAAAGAVAFTFTSYNIILFAAGHTNQIFAIAFFAPILASIILTLRGKHLLGASLTALFLAMEIRANHIQMTYYLMIALFILVGIELYHAIKDKAMPAFLKSIAYLAIAIVIGVAVNASLLWSTYQYGKESYRGKSNLTQHTNEPGNGLDKTYAYQYSQGVAECFTFLVPNAYGGDSFTQRLDQNSETAKALIARGMPEEQAVGAANQIAGQIPGLGLYWGNKPGTAGPDYFGAVICFLFVLGLLIVRSRLKWWLLATVVLTMLLSFGGNFPYVSDLFFKYFPLYNKFRTLDSILAVTGFCFAILALLALREVIGSTDKKDLFKKIKIALYITGGLALILVVVPGMFLNFRAQDQTNGVSILAQALKGDNATANTVASAIVKDRKGLEESDAIRSLIFILIAFGVLWLFVKQKINATVLSLGFLALILIDLWPVDKRYLKDENFSDKQTSYLPKPREIDQLIQRDTDPDYRVIDLSQSPKYDVTTPFFHKSVWGYSAARLKRFDELIDNQFTKSTNMDVLNMLNTKYIISQDPKTGNLTVQHNDDACGHAWFVKDVEYVKNADQAMEAISAFSPKEKAIVDGHFKNLIEGKNIGFDPNGTITLTKYSPDDLVYQSGSTTNAVAVFSEIYYDKGWKMYIDGKEQPYFRADYILRAAVIPVGNHKIEFKFHPASYYTGETISLAGSIILMLGLGGAIFIGVRKKKEEEKKAA
ncbi:MAG TPA: YfhO family protein, partial [Mucilaginibacter sp.]|nr:YfhO family protein [Mucilaginibacter sp.]